MKKVALTELDPRLQKQITAADQQLKTNPQIERPNKYKRA